MSYRFVPISSQNGYFFETPGISGFRSGCDNLMLNMMILWYSPLSYVGHVVRECYSSYMMLSSNP